MHSYHVFAISWLLLNGTLKTLLTSRSLDSPSSVESRLSPEHWGFFSLCVRPLVCTAARYPARPRPNPSSSAVSCLLGLSACQPLWERICCALWPCRKHARAPDLARMWWNVTVWFQQKVSKHTGPILFSGDLSSVRGEHSCSTSALWTLVSFRLRRV